MGHVEPVREKLVVNILNRLLQGDDVKANAMRHIMPKEILDAVDLQPQYRTFSEIRDNVLMYTWETCVIRQESWYSHSTSEHKHEHSHCHKDYHSSPNGCVSDELERFEK